MKIRLLPAGIRARIRLAAGLVVAGLVIELLSLLWVHPFAFMAHLGLGVPLIALGMVVFVIAAVTTPLQADVTETGTGS